MKKLIVLSMVASLATLAYGTSAQAQAVALKPMFATVACKGNTAACVKLGLYQKIAATGTSIGSATARVGADTARSAGNSNAAAVNPATSRRGRSSGGVENNPAENGGSALSKVYKNADMQAKLIAKNARARAVSENRAYQHARSGQVAHMRNRVMNRGGDPTINNPDSSGRAAVHRPMQNADRVNRASRLHSGDARAQQIIRARQNSRSRPTDF